MDNNDNEGDVFQDILDAEYRLEDQRMFRYAIKQGYLEQKLTYCGCPEWNYSWNGLRLANDVLHGGPEVDEYIDKTHPEWKVFVLLDELLEQDEYRFFGLRVTALEERATATPNGIDLNWW